MFGILQGKKTAAPKRKLSAEAKGQTGCYPAKAPGWSGDNIKYRLTAGRAFYGAATAPFLDSTDRRTVSGGRTERGPRLQHANMNRQFRSLRTRLERLEAVQSREMAEANLTAIVKNSLGVEGQFHLEPTAFFRNQAHSFEMRPGPGPQIEDFGQFEAVVWLTTAESNF